MYIKEMLVCVSWCIPTQKTDPIESYPASFLAKTTAGKPAKQQQN